MSLARRTLLALSTSAWLRDRATSSPLVRRSVSRFMPGERLDDALDAARQQHARGISAILTQLGENLTSTNQAEGVTDHYLTVLEAVKGAGIDAHISVKPTQLGLDLDPGLCLRNLLRLVDRASQLGQFVWIDMESSAYVDRTLELFRRTCERSPRIGVALQAYLHRTANDLEQLLPIAPAIRLVKGAYLEKPSVAFPKKSDVDENFERLAVRLLAETSRREGMVVHLATHDARLIERLNRVIAEQRITSSAYEYAMLYGIQTSLQQRLAAEGRRMRVLIAYGDNWFPWYMRRLAERPANVWFVVKNLGV
jgi:proline dehydrogenase